MDNDFDFTKGDYVEDQAQDRDFESIFKSKLKAVSEDMSSSVQQNYRKEMTPPVDPPRAEAVSRPVEVEAERIERLSDSDQQINEFHLAQMDKKWGVIDRLANRGLYEQVASVKVELMKASSKYRLAFYDTLLEARLDALREKCDAGLKQVKAMYRSQLASFLLQKMEELTLEVSGRQRTFIEAMRAKHAYADSLTDVPSLQRKYLESIFAEEARYLAFLEANLKHFEGIVHKQLGPGAR